MGNFFIYKAFMKSYKKEFRSYIKHNKQVSSVISINPSQLFVNSNEIYWEDDNKEVIFKGQLYDVIEIKCKGGKVHLQVLSDVNEQEMKKEFAESNNAFSKKNSSGLMKVLKQFLGLKYICFDNVYCLSNPTDSKITFGEFDFDLFSGYIFLSENPPESLI